MHTGQMLLVLGAIVIFSMIVLNVNKALLNSTEMSLEAESTVTATTLAQSIITEITSKAFDTYTANSTVESVDELTSAYGLGRAWSENITVDDTNLDDYSDLNDIDDFNGHSDVVNTPRFGDYTLSMEVKYVNPSNPDQVVYTRTWMKRIKVTVTGPSLEQPLTLYYYSSY